ncbi:MAG: hypothetical protein ABEI74_03680 [Candidatus Pacearchaeota archaeon]
MAQEQSEIKEFSEELKGLKEKVSELSSLVEDLVFAQSTEEALKEYDRGEYNSYSKEEFLDKLEKW